MRVKKGASTALPLPSRAGSKRARRTTIAQVVESSAACPAD
jgi:hypothetical protein